MTLLFALLTALCAVVVATLFVTMWLEGDVMAVVVLSVALLPLLVLTIMAWRVAL